jgi:hypothetical protein
MKAVHLTERMLRAALRPHAAEELKVWVVRHVAMFSCCFAVVRYLCELESCGGLGLWFPTAPPDVLHLRHKAEPLWDELCQVALPEQLACVQRERRLQHWGLCELLCGESVRLAARDPHTARDRAHLAVGVAMAMEQGQIHDESWVAALRALAWAHLANAERVCGDPVDAKTSKAFRLPCHVERRRRLPGLWIIGLPCGMGQRGQPFVPVGAQ